MTGTIDCFEQTDIGRVRTTNEDQFLIADVGKSLRVNQTSLGLDRHKRLVGGTQDDAEQNRPASANP
ncbi:MAG: hypothetical protein ACI8P0_004788 [Planctomycetaceae bacterium]|jgi:hypothetical protein